MTTHSSILAWRIPGTAEPGGLPSMRSQRVGHDWSDLAAVASLNRYLNFIEYSYIAIDTQLYEYLEKEMATHSSTLAWKIPWTKEPGRLQTMGSRRVGHKWATSLSLSLFTFTDWRRKWQPTPVFLPGESQGWGSLVGCCLWGRIESDTTEVT